MYIYIYKYIYMSIYMNIYLYYINTPQHKHAYKRPLNNVKRM